MTKYEGTDAGGEEATLPLPGSGEPPAFEVFNAGGASSAVLICDHASNRVPWRLGTLGLDASQLADHIGWDPGAAAVARALSVRLDAPLVMSGYSRLVIDCNRPLGSPDSIPVQSAGVAVPGNLGLSTAERDRRIQGLFQPYHAAIGRLLDSRHGRPTLLLSIHSFTPVLDGRSRPWPIGVCHARDHRLADLMRGALARGADFTVGDNQPYAIEDLSDYSIPVHGDGRGLPAIMIEIRQDGIASADGAAAWAGRIADAFVGIEARARRLFQQ